MSPLKTVVATLFLGAFAAFSARVKHQLIRTGQESGLDSLPLGKQMPDFTLKDTAGKAVTLSTLTPKPTITMVNFWGTWCPPCRIEMPGFETMYAEQAKNGLQILAIDENDPRAKLDAYLKSKPVSFPILLDPGGALADRFGVRAFPTTVLIGRDGSILQVIEGVEPYLSSEIAQRLKAQEEIDLKAKVHEGKK